MADQQPSQQSSHVRTYARDVATLTGKPLPKNVQNEVPAAPPPPPPPLTPAPVPTPTVTLPSDPEKEAALTRMKARMVLPPEPKAPEPIAPLPPVSKEPLPQPPLTSSPIHTYKTDFAAHVQGSGASRISILAAQQDASAAPVVLPEVKKKRFGMIALSVFLIVVGIVGVTTAYRYATQQVVPPELFVPSLIFADERVAVSGSGEELRQKLGNLTEARELSDGGVVVTYITYASTTPDGKTVNVPASGGALIEALRLSAPDILLRNIAPESTVGVVRAGSETRPFFILRVTSYERTYAGMLSWESTMERDLAVLYPPYPVEATTTPLTETAFRVSFIDEVIDNHDVRVLRDAENRPLMLYGYRDKDTLIIARDEQAFRELLARLAATRAR
ncbi:MAG TPA: hypothetical protein VEB18_01380 [Candidatus Paceibacterota bacterium]|nr:hypothetical protein [Candidatus Paceibacterota bacterium]